MIEADLRRARRTLRAVARPRLRALLEWCAYHALVPFDGRDFDDGAIVEVDAAVARAVDDLADRGAFSYFGIDCSAELGEVRITVMVVDQEIGRVRADVSEAVEAILHGGATRDGWASPDKLTVEDLER